MVDYEELNIPADKKAELDVWHKKFQSLVESIQQGEVMPDSKEVASALCDYSTYIKEEKNPLVLVGAIVDTSILYIGDICHSSIKASVDYNDSSWKVGVAAYNFLLRLNSIMDDLYLNKEPYEEVKLQPYYKECLFQGGSHRGCSGLVTTIENCLCEIGLKAASFSSDLGVSMKAALESAKSYEPTRPERGAALNSRGAVLNSAKFLENEY
ncbi:MAG: hypothetical protein PHW76_06600 [Alphaproteobacteria bacterium]|nr:hypothetical protein [Alphaproteobacteria bacterium]